jgi:hypothetical protein
MSFERGTPDGLRLGMARVYENGTLWRLVTTAEVFSGVNLRRIHFPYSSWVIVGTQWQQSRLRSWQHRVLFGS